MAYNRGQWYDTSFTRIYKTFGITLFGTVPNYTIGVDTAKIVTFGDTAITGGKILSKFQYKVKPGNSNGQLPYWDAGQGMWVPSAHMNWNDTSDIFTTKNIYAGGTITANTNLIFNSLNNYLTNSVSDTMVVDSLGYIKKRIKAVYQHEISTDAENNISVPFLLKPTSLVFYNGNMINSTRWSGVGTTTLNVSLDTRQYDKVIIQM